MFEMLYKLKFIFLSVAKVSKNIEDFLGIMISYKRSCIYFMKNGVMKYYYYNFPFEYIVKCNFFL